MIVRTGRVRRACGCLVTAFVLGVAGEIVHDAHVCQDELGGCKERPIQAHTLDSTATSS